MIDSHTILIELYLRIYRYSLFIQIILLLLLILDILTTYISETESFVKNLYDVIESKEYMPVPPKKKRVFTEVKEVKAKDDPKPERKISIDTKKVFNL